MAKKNLMSELLELAASPSAIGSTILAHTQANTDGVENEEDEPSKISRARSLMKSLITDEDFDRQELIEKMMSALNVTESTATSYFQRIAKEMGLTNLGKDSDSSDGAMTADEEESHVAAAPMAKEETLELPDEVDELTDEIPESDDPNRQGIIRVVQNAHLIYKRQNAEGTFDELWIYNSSEDAMQNDLEIRRDILAGTDIEPKKTSSADGTQEYRLSNMGNGQMLEITGLPQ